MKILNGMFFPDGFGAFDFLPVERLWLLGGAAVDSLSVHWMSPLASTGDSQTAGCHLPTRQREG